jgi:DNA replicative helicase MCM subunit Mcm2 (Cdc46/Mcm family)
MTTHLHHHEPPNTKRSLAIYIIRSFSKIKDTEQTHEKPNKIIRKELLVDKSGLQDVLNYYDINLIRRSIYCSRKQQFPILSKSQKESFDQLYDMQSIIKYNDQQFCFVNQQKSIVIITCRDNLQLLCKSKNVFGNGIFSYCPKFFC